MDILKVILQPELIAILVCLCAGAGALYVLVQFVKEKEIVQKRLNTVDAELARGNDFDASKSDSMATDVVCGRVNQLQGVFR